jgi:putative ABC transport system permease protein
MLISRLLASFRRAEMESDLDEEVRSHIAQLEEDYWRNGLSRQEARRRAVLDFGGIEQVKERYRDRYRLPTLESVLQDIIYAARTFLKHPGFTATAIVTLALGIGANTAVFSMVYSVLFRPLGYKDSDRIVRIVQHQPPGPDNVPVRLSAISTDDLRRWRTRTRAFSQMAVYFPTSFILHEGGMSTRIRAAILSPDMFTMLGGKPLLGRVFEAAEEKEGNNNVVVLSYSAWQKYFGGATDVLHRTVNLSGRGYIVVGVMAKQFIFPDRETEFWLPFLLETRESGGFALVQTLARRADGVSMDKALAEANVLFRGFRQEDNQLPGATPDAAQAPDGFSIELIGIKDELVQPVRRAFLVLMVAVGFVLLIACANVANLLLARAAGRQAEMAIRAALGAGRSRLIRQMLTESLMLALGGGVLGTVLARGGIELVAALGTGYIPRAEEIRMDMPAFVFTIVVSILTGILFGLAPVLRLPAANHMEAIHATCMFRSDLFSRSRIRSVLAIAEIALAVMLLTGSGLLIRSFLKLSATNWGFNPQNLLTFQVELANDANTGAVSGAMYEEQILSSIRALPSIHSAALATSPPWLEPFVGMGGKMLIAGRQQEFRSSVRVVSDDYFRTMGMALIQGSSPEVPDRRNPGRGVFVNRALARRFFSKDDVVGEQIPFGRIAGVVEDVRYLSLDSEPEPEIYLTQQAASVMPPPPPPPGLPPGVPVPKGPGEGFKAVAAVRTSGNPMDVVPNIRGVVGQIDTRLIIDDVASMDERVSAYVALPRFYAVVLGIFSSIAVALAMIGIYGLMAYSVSHRTREIGIRVALGACTREVLWLVLRQGLALSSIGIVIGIVGALLLTRYLKTLLTDLTATDPLTYVIVVALVVFAAISASYLPARRSAKVDPVIALRYE